MGDTFTRAKPLNALTLAALPDALVSIDNDIEYLQGSVQGYPDGKLKDRFAARLANLQRSRDWLASIIATRGEVSTP